MLREKSRVMKRGGTTQDNFEYIQTCKAIRQEMKDDIQAFNGKQVLEAIEKNRSLKHARRKQCIGKKIAHIYHGRRWQPDSQQGLHSNMLC